MPALRTIAVGISLAAFLSILFYFMPRAMDRLLAKSPPSRPLLTSLWWHKLGWLAEPEAIVVLFWFAMLFGSLAAALLLSGKWLL
jgi:hypothetical protein